MATGKARTTRKKPRAKTPARPETSAPGKGAAPVEDCLVLSGALVIHEAQEQATRLRAARAAGVRRFDLSALRAIDTAGVQLLVALAKEGVQSEPGLELFGCPVHVREAVRSLGLDAALEPLFREAA